MTLIARLSDKLNKPFIPVCITLILYIFFLVFLLQYKNKDITSLITAGSQFTNKKELISRIDILSDSSGYDGQFFYRLALNPFTQKQKEYGILLDTPFYRQQRLLYPLMASLISLGNPLVIPYAMVIVNIIFLCILALYGCLYAQRRKKHALWGLVFSLYAGFLFTLSRDLAEIISSGFFLAGLFYFDSKKFKLASLLFSLAVLTKETAMILPLSICMVGIWERSIKKIVVGILPVVTYFIWHGWLIYNWKENTTFGVQSNMDIPFRGIWLSIKIMPQQSIYLQNTYFLELLFLFSISLLSFIYILRRKINLYLITILILYSLLLVSLSLNVWREDYGFMRAFSEMFIVIFFILMRFKTKAVIVAGLISISLWIYIGKGLLTLR
ncbi:MAG: hypothetical protein Q7S61_00880 [bacterium]|nr:hypothetical protein [bacterium]